MKTNLYSFLWASKLFKFLVNCSGAHGANVGVEALDIEAVDLDPCRYVVHAGLTRPVVQQLD